MKHIQFIIKSGLFLLIVQVTLSASVFGVYGIGLPLQNSTATDLGRGSVSTAYTDSISANLNNPALLYAIRRSGIEAGLQGNYVRNRHGNISEAKSTFDGAMLKVPLGLKGGLMIGMVPLYRSNVEYLMSNDQFSEQINTTGEVYAFTIAAGYKVAAKLSVGLSLEAISGSIRYETIVDVADEDATDVRLFRSNGFDGRCMSGGISWQPTAKMTVGAVYAHNFWTSRREIFERGASDGTYYFLYSDKDTTNYNENIMPDALTLGISYRLDNGSSVMADYHLMNYNSISDNLVFSSFSQGTYENFHRFAAGWERSGTHQMFAPYYKKVTLRAGMIYDRGMISLDGGNPYRSAGLTLGLGLPLNNFTHRIDAALVLGRTSGTIYVPDNATEDIINEQEFFIHFKISLIAMEKWFNTKGKYR